MVKTINYFATGFDYNYITGRLENEQSQFNTNEPFWVIFEVGNIEYNDLVEIYVIEQFYPYTEKFVGSWRNNSETRTVMGGGSGNQKFINPGDYLFKLFINGISYSGNYAPVTIIQQGFLDITNIEAPSTANVGELITIIVNVKNTGGDDTFLWEASDDRREIAHNVLSILAGEETSISFDAFMPGEAQDYNIHIKSYHKETV